MTSQTPAGSKKVSKIKQACDCCHVRKIRCDGTQPCNNCRLNSLSCSYLSIPKKKGPKGPSKRTPRAVLKMQLQQANQRSPKDHSSSSTFSYPSYPEHASGSSLDFPSRSFDPSPLLSDAVVKQYVDSWFKHKYDITPILHRERFSISMANFRESPETYSLVASLCAALASQSQPDQSSIGSPDDSSTESLPAEFFINEAKRARQFRDFDDKPVLSDVHTGFFLFAALFNLDRNNSAWFYLREAITMIQLLRLHEEETYTDMDDIEALFSRRTFWLLFTTERAYALQRHRPLTLQRTIALPEPSSEDPDASIISGFLDLVSLFQNFDDNFVSLWNVSSRTQALPFASSDSALVAGQLAALQSTLSGAIPDVSKRTEIQQADLLISRLWLKTMTWQLSVTKGLLSSASQNECMSFHYPVSIAREVVAVSNMLNMEAFEPHGVGILEKIFDIGCSLADVMQLSPHISGIIMQGMEVGPRDYLMEMLRLCSTMVGGSTRYASLLAAKANECMQPTPRGAIENSQVGKIVDIDEEQERQVGNPSASQSFEAETLPLVSEPPIFDLGALSDVSIAWLGSMSNEICTELEPWPEELYNQIS